MVHEKWVLLCKKCGWRKEVPMLWADLKPRYCNNKKCRCSFATEPEMLAAFKLEQKVVEQQEEVTETVSYKSKKNKNW
jgi:invasion protein IalB